MNGWEKEILENTRVTLENELGKPVILELEGAPDKTGVDATLRLLGRKVLVETKKEIGTAHLAQISRIRKGRQPLLAVAEYIAPEARKALKALQINYLDNSGNMLLRLGQVHIFIEGIPSSPPPVRTKTKLWGKAGLLVVFHLLNHPKAVNLGYRDLAIQAGVALGNMPAIFRALREEGYLFKVNERSNQLRNIDQLSQMWAKEFIRRLKPSLVRQRFRAVDPDFRDHWEQATIPSDAVWGGQPGAHLLMGDLTPGHFTLYTDTPTQELMRTMRWVPDAKGNIEVLDRFWHETLPKIPPALLVYADLLDEQDLRATETATMIYDKLLRTT